jgi:hypothetical protein
MLIEYLSGTRWRDTDLPIVRTTIRRLRAAAAMLGWENAWWLARQDDLLSLTLEQFSARQGCRIGAASQRRASLLRC